MPVGADPYQIPLPSDSEKPDSTSPKIFGFNLNIKGLATSLILILSTAISRNKSYSYLFILVQGMVSVIRFALFLRQ